MEENDAPAPPAICPGPNLAYFSRTFSLKEMVDHIYGRTDLLNGVKRPNMFIAELNMYIDFFKTEIKDSLHSLNDQRLKYLKEYRDHLVSGIDYYRQLIPKMKQQTQEYLEQMTRELVHCESSLNEISKMHPQIM